jgi:predicted lipid-binding transport protein (Tim44 family)
MKKLLGMFAIVLALGMVGANDAEAKRLGGARNSGMQKQQTTQPATPPAGQQSTAGAAAPAAGTAAAAGAAGAKRSWMGPIAGLAAGLGLAALASHLGFGEALANMMMIGLLVMAVVVVIGLVMRKRAAASGAAPAWAGAGAGSGAPRGGSPAGAPLGGTRIGSALGGMPAARTQAGNIPADFDVAAFSRNAKLQFLALQSANDAGDFDRLRDTLTPEMFEAVREEVQARGGATQSTEVFGLEAQVIDVAEEADRYVVSVKFTGSVREQAGSVPDDLNEIWHLTKPRTGFGGWVVAGIQQAA